MQDILGYAVFCAVLTGAGWLLAVHLSRVYQGGRNLLSPVMGPVERVVYGAAGIRSDRAQGWVGYALSALTFNLLGFLVLYAILRLQALLPMNPAGIAGMAPDLAFNTAISFVTNTNWQAYGGEVQLTYLAQMLGLTVQNFASAATGMAVGVAVIRGFCGAKGAGLGNFWVDMTRSVLYVLLPLSLVLTVVLMLQGVPQTLLGAAHITTVEGADQIIARGPVAAQVAIKQLGTNGGGFFAANAAHPFENPTILSNMLQTLSILLIPVSFCFLFGRMAHDRRQGWAIFAAMGVLFVAGLLAIWWAEGAVNLESKETRFGTGLSVLWAAATTAASNGSVNSMHDSFMPLSGLVMMLNIQVGEVIFGGVGAGLYGMLLYVVLAVFLAGLMVGRTPEYLGRKIESREVALAMMAFLSIPLGILVGSAVSLTMPDALASVQEPGPHGLAEVLYAYSSAVGNNGSAFGGFNAGTPWQTTALGLLMILGRYTIMVPMLAIAGSMVTKSQTPATAGTFPTHGPLFVTLLILTVVVLGALTFFPALALGPIAEHMAMIAGDIQ